MMAVYGMAVLCTVDAERRRSLSYVLGRSSLDLDGWWRRVEKRGRSSGGAEGVY